MKELLTIIVWLSLCFPLAFADPTWPASTDELEDFMYVTTGYGASGLASKVIPCSSPADGDAGRRTSAEWIRVAFHDMSTTNIYAASTGSVYGGIDASLMYELNSGENIGAGFNTSLTTYGQFFSTRTSVADLVALGLSLATRSCGGPVVPVKTGRIDATAAGPQGVPQPQNSLFTFENQFLRMGFNTTEMIYLVACGHSVGGVHAGNFPNIVTAGTFANDYAPFDDTLDVFDDHVATQYLGGTTVDPLAQGPCAASTRCSDKVTFAADNNATLKTINTPTTFNSICGSMFQRMIETVPPTVSLGSALAPYTVKPYSLQLTLLAGGASIKFTGNIRVRTTNGAVSSVQLTYLDRTGAAGGVIATTLAGTASGLDDTFSFFGLSATLDSTKSISSFTVQVTYTTGAVTTYNNNGAGYAVQDSVMFLAPQSCLDAATGNMTVMAAVRSTSVTAPSLNLALKTPRYASSAVPVPALASTSLTMKAGSTVGPYTLYSTSTTLSSYQIATTQFNVTAGTAIDMFKTTSGMGTTCSPFGSSASSSSSTTSRASTSSLISSTSTTSSQVSQTTPAIKPTISGYNYLGCYTEATNARALNGASYFDYSAMTLEKCSADCVGYSYWGVEYGGECYCGNALGIGSVIAPPSDCSFLCPGNSLEYCGAGSRLELYGPALSSSTSSTITTTSKSSTSASSTSKSSISTSISTSKPSTSVTSSASSTLASTTSAKPSTTTKSTLKSSTSTSTSKSSTLSSSSSSASPTGPSQPAKVGSWTFYGCQTEATNSRALTIASFAYDSMTLESCASNCTSVSATLFGAEYGRECYCGTTLASGSVAAPASDCNMVCGGNSFEYCGASNRLSVYQLGSNAAGSSGLIASTSRLSTSSLVATAKSSSTKATTTSATPTSSRTSTSRVSASSSSSKSSTGSLKSSTTSLRSSTISLKSSTGSSKSSTTSLKSSTISLKSSTISSRTSTSSLKSSTISLKSSTSSLKSSTISSKSSKLTAVTSTKSSSSSKASSKVTTSTSSRTSSSTRTSTTTTATGPTLVPTAGTYSYIGCYSEGTNARALSAATYVNYTMMSIEICHDFCIQQGAYSMFGVEYSGECYCGSSLSSGSVLEKDSDCNLPCDGTPTEYCGAGNRLCVYGNVTTGTV